MGGSGFADIKELPFSTSQLQQPLVGQSAQHHRHVGEHALARSGEATDEVELRSMERAQLIRRLRANDDRRKVRVFLTAKAKRLRDELLTVARGITDEAEVGIGARELALFRRVIAHMTANLDRVAN